MPEDLNRAVYTYECVGVLLHAGSSSGGHYTALLREPPRDARRPEAATGSEGAGRSEEWFEFDDASVQPAPPHAFRDAAGGGATHQQHPCAALRPRRVAPCRLVGDPLVEGLRQARVKCRRPAAGCVKSRRNLANPEKTWLNQEKPG